MVPEGLAVRAGGRDAPGQVEPGVGRDRGGEVPPQRVVEDVPGPDPAKAEDEQEPEEQERVGHLPVSIGTGSHGDSLLARPVPGEEPGDSVLVLAGPATGTAEAGGALCRPVSGGRESPPAPSRPARSWPGALAVPGRSTARGS